MAIDLVKGQKIDLSKSDGSELSSMCVGLNWGAIQKKGFFGGVKHESVDLDASAAMFDENGTVLDVIYFGNLQNAYIKHSGDDMTGDTDGDDGLDNEIIMVNLGAAPANVEKIVFILNSFQGHDFAIVPHASIRIYEGTPEKVNNVLATFNVAQDPKFSGSTSMVMGRAYRRNNKWKFASIGEPTRDRDLKGTVETVRTNFL